MRQRWFFVTGILCVALLTAPVGCSRPFISSFAAQAVKPTDLVRIKHRVLKSGAVGTDTGFKLLWIPFMSPSEADAKADMLERLNKEGISTAGKNIAFSNVTADRGGFGFIGLIGAPSIKLVADVIELLGEEPPSAAVPQN
ncbi:MAG: hypothetical protein OEU68_00045 [Nitrospira sp.]|jgi:hypothetical protein|nr:hypothetical protein [Nitrospira sp.]MDH4243763.1 hypothetical protein [Nitrospira sp.]MDH4356429.1 hypothetical protein [Nitrospira sp.]MDH5318789.1 hypothetical protein [Nitrospira sp.]